MSNPSVFYFVGVTTGQSSIMRVFPRWMAELGRDVRLVGVDVPLHAPPERYRDLVSCIKRDPLALGGLVTTHKLDLLRAARDQFDALDPWAELCGEVSSIAKRGDRLVGSAKDPISAGLSLGEFVPAGHWARTRAEVVCLGAGGAGAAIVAHLCARSDPHDRPARITVVDVNPARLDHLGTVVAQLQSSAAVRCTRSDGAQANDAVLAALPPGSLVINATGLGKDLPGSPITDAAVFPRDGFAWELNYRGGLDFLRQARAQEAARRLTVGDGWRYFLHGWSQVIADVLDVEIDPARIERWARLAAPTARPCRAA